MDQEQLINRLEHLYLPKREILSLLPLGTSLDRIWPEIVQKRRSKATLLPLLNSQGEPNWFVVTDPMIAASEKIVEEAMLPYHDSGMAMQEEAFYTSYLDGSPLTIEEAMSFAGQNHLPRNMHEQLFQNNRKAIAFAMEHVYHPLSGELICTLAGYLNEKIGSDSGNIRNSDKQVIPCMNGETCTLSKAAVIPGMMQAFISYLLDGSVHPLLKAAVAHAWFMVVRPFNEGNERLARLVASMILTRAKYTFFNEVSLSALIAQDGYGYYDAVANVLREEHSGDWTYLVEYYISLLGRAVDEIHQRRLNQEAELGRQILTKGSEQDSATMEQEPAMAEYTGVQETNLNEYEMPDMPVTEEDQKEPSREENGEDVTEDVLSRAGFVTMNLSQDAFEKSEFDNTGQMLYEELVDKLTQMSERPSEINSRIGKRLLRFLKEGKLVFTRTELTDGITYNTKRSSNIICHLRGQSLIVTNRLTDKHVAFYRLNLQDDFRSNDYSPGMLALIKQMMDSKYSLKDRRIGEMLLRKRHTGYIDIADYQEIHELSKWQKDMELCVLLGVVTRETNDRYRINQDYAPRFGMLKSWQKNMVSALYNKFGKEVFTSEMITANMYYGEGTTSAALHAFTLMGILDCALGENKDDYNMYQFLITPEDHPECFRDVA